MFYDYRQDDQWIEVNEPTRNDEPSNERQEVEPTEENDEF